MTIEEEMELDRMIEPFIASVRSLCDDLKHADLDPRARALAITKLEEAVMWIGYGAAAKKQAAG